MDYCWFDYFKILGIGEILTPTKMLARDGIFVGVRCGPIWWSPASGQSISGCS